MKANELRIGNQVFYNDKIITVDEFPEVVILLNQLKPIPLTDEWLLKNGFKFKDELAYPFNKYYSNRFFALDEKKLYMIRYIEDDGHLHMKRPEYVHQFQNIVFALTNDELKINI